MRILVELDAMLDTRLATVARINPEAAVALVQHPDYYTRTSDNFEKITGIPHAEYVQAYANRNSELLAHSRPTHAVIMLWEMTNELFELSRTTPEVPDGVTLEINTYPYQLDDEDREWICSALNAYCMPGTKIVPTYLSPSQLTPVMLKKQYSAYVVYNFDRWYSANSQILAQLPMPRVTIYAPAIFVNDEPQWTEEDKKHLQGKDPFGLFEQSHATMVKLHFFDSNGFSILQHWRLPEDSPILL